MPDSGSAVSVDSDGVLSVKTAISESGAAVTVDSGVSTPGLGAAVQ